MKATMRAVAMLLVATPLLGGSRSIPCEAEDREWLRWGDLGVAQLEGPVVPDDEIWVVRAAGIAVQEGSGYGGGEFMLQIERPVRSQGGACCWKIPLARTAGSATGTPVLALGREVELRPGEALSARANATLGSSQLGLLMVYDAWPRECR